MLLLDATSNLGIPKSGLGTPNKYFGTPKFFPLKKNRKLLSQLPQAF
jgi:hypothetical protein